MRILVLAGGSSAERTVSLRSGSCVAAALETGGHEVLQVDPAETRLTASLIDQCEIAVPLVHGTGGEDGVLLRHLERLELPWVGSSVAASELTFDKIETNRLLQQHGVPVPDHVILHSGVSLQQAEATVRRLGTRVVTKPPRQGSSIGISLVTQRQDLSAGLAAAFKYGDRCMVERFVPGREVTVAVCDGRALPVVEIQPVDWYDYRSKYHDDATTYEIDRSASAVHLQRLAVRVCEVCQVAGICRVDFRVDPAGEAFVLEVNTIPGMTDHSLVPMAAAAEGLSLCELWERAAEVVLHRRRS